MQWIISPPNFNQLMRNECCDHPCFLVKWELRRAKESAISSGARCRHLYCLYPEAGVAGIWEFCHGNQWGKPKYYLWVQSSGVWGFLCPQVLLTSIFENSIDAHLTITWVPILLKFTESPIIYWIYSFPRNSGNFHGVLPTFPTICHLRQPAVLEDSTAFSPYMTSHQAITKSHRWPLL